MFNVYSLPALYLSRTYCHRTSIDPLAVHTPQQRTIYANLHARTNVLLALHDIRPSFNSPLEIAFNNFNVLQ